MKVWIINGVGDVGQQLPSKKAGIAAYTKYVKRYYKSGARPALVVGDVDR